MELFTARYTNPNVQGSGLIPVGITVGSPRWIYYALATMERAFAPDRKWLNAGLSMEEFQDRFVEKMNKDPGAAAIRILERIYQRHHNRTNPERGLVLLCYEDIRKPGEWCHRRMLAGWLEDRFAISVPELPEDGPKGGSSKTPNAPSKPRLPVTGKIQPQLLGCRDWPPAWALPRKPTS